MYGLTVESMERLHAQILVSLTGVDETVEGTLHARHLYAARNIMFDRRFVDVIHMGNDGHRYLDYTYFHETIAI